MADRGANAADLIARIKPCATPSMTPEIQPADSRRSPSPQHTSWSMPASRPAWATGSVSNSTASTWRKSLRDPTARHRVRETNSTKNGTPSASRSLVGAAKPIGLASSTDAEIIREELRTPRAAAVAGVVFSLLFGASLVLIRVSVPGNPTDARNWLTNSGRRHAVLLAVNLVPFAGIAFLPAPRAAPIVVGRR
jgi:hypothetical protein